MPWSRQPVGLAGAPVAATSRECHPHLPWEQQIPSRDPSPFLAATGRTGLSSGCCVPVLGCSSAPTGHSAARSTHPAPREPGTPAGAARPAQPGAPDTATGLFHGGTTAQHPPLPTETPRDAAPKLRLQSDRLSSPGLRRTHRGRGALAEMSEHQLPEQTVSKQGRVRKLFSEMIW